MYRRIVYMISYTKLLRPLRKWDQREIPQKFNLEEWQCESLSFGIYNVTRKST